MNYFRHGRFTLEYENSNVLGLIETYLLDIYRTTMLRPDDIVVDLGAGIGDFAIKASRSVSRVIAIEPNKEDFELLSRNIKRNNAVNVIALNVGVANNPGTETITFGGRSYSFQVETLQNILQQNNITKVDVLKVDIEGFESDVLESISEILKNVRMISIELHGTKRAINNLLLPLGFKFIPLTKGEIYRKAIKLLLSNPRLFVWALRQRKSNRMMPDIVSEQNGLAIGTYIR